VTILHKDIC